MSEPYVALLRGINLGARNKVKMPDLKALLEGLGYRDVATYLQSGNAIFTPLDGVDAASLEADIERVIASELGLQIPVMVRSAREMVRAAAANPFVAEESNPRKLHVAFLKRPFPETDVAIPESTDRYHITEREMYFHHPEGTHSAKVTSLWFERKLGIVLTARNWRTVSALAERMTQSLG